MDQNVKNVVEECTRGSDEERLSFPEVLDLLARVGVERYHADLVRAEKVYYLPTGQAHVVSSEALATQPALEFSAAGVEAAVRAIQARRVGYREFCRLIAAAGCAGYFVSLCGRRAVYYGRTTELFVEPFPPVR